MTDVRLDLDNMSRKQLLGHVGKVWPFLFRFHWPTFGVLRVSQVMVWRTTHGWHCAIHVKNEICNRYTAFLQLALGSDVRRECLNLQRILCCPEMEEWSILYERKFEADGKVTSQERFDWKTTKRIWSLIEKFQKRSKKP